MKKPRLRRQKEIENKLDELYNLKSIDFYSNKGKLNAKIEVLEWVLCLDETII